VRILLDYRPALRAPTGVGEYAHQLASALARRLGPGDQLTLFSSSWKDRLHPGRVPGAQIRDIRVPVRILNLMWHRLEWPPVERLAGRYDVVHALHPLAIPSRHAAQFVTIHDLDFLDHPERTRAEIRRDYPELAPAHARAAARVVTVSQFTAGEIVRRLGVPLERVVICPSGAPAWPARSAPVPRGPILFMGTLEPRKNVGVLLDAYARLFELRPDAPRLALAGGATPAAAEWLERIRHPPLAGRVEHLGYVEPASRYDLYASASMLVLPSHLEGFGLPVLEAMTVGLPVIVSDRGALPEVLGGAGQVVSADDAGGLAAAMQRYLDDPAAAAEAIRRGLDRAKAFSWDATADTLATAYTTVMRERARRG
jgi:glycosyltransferase involved in cell wall biosynthesis